MERERRRGRKTLKLIDDIKEEDIKELRKTPKTGVVRDNNSDERELPNGRTPGDDDEGRKNHSKHFQ